MLPIPPLDGLKVFFGSRLTYVFAVTAIIVGAIILVSTLIQEFSGKDTEVQIAEVSAAVMVFVYGLALTALGSAMAALRTIAVNCARMVEKEQS